MKKRKSLSEIIPIWYRVAERKETIRRHVKDLVSNNNFSNSYLSNRLPNEIYRHKSKIIKTGKDIDPILQENKAFNIELSSSKINGLVIKPNEVFSFWKLVGKVNKKMDTKKDELLLIIKLKQEWEEDFVI